MTIKAPFDEIILHIGCEKTGSTAIQEYFSKSRDLHLNLGILYPLRIGKNHVPLVKSTLNGDIANYSIPSDSRDCYSEKIKEKLNFEIRVARDKYAVNRLIFSAEHFHTKFLSSRDIFNLIAFLPATKKFKVVCYLRRQDRAHLSLYSTSLIAGSVHDFSFGAFNKSIPWRYNYSKLVELWSGNFDSKSVNFLIYDDVVRSESICENFCKEIGVKYYAEYDTNTNISLDVDCMKALKLFNIAFMNTNLNFEYRKQFIQYLRDSSLKERKFYPSKSEAISYFEKFKHVNSQAMISFDNSFEEYPLESILVNEMRANKILKSFYDFQKVAGNFPAG
jgi:hypothetical protein